MISKPNLFKTKLNKKIILADLSSGFMVSIISLPLCIGFALSCGLSIQQGIWAGIISGIVASLLGGSNFQITGTTGAFVMTLVLTKTLSGMLIAMVMAGIILIILSFFSVGKLLKYVPYAVVTGFTSGIGIIILASQLSNFFGIESTPSSSSMLKFLNIFEHIADIDFATLIVGILAVLIIVIYPKFEKKISSSLIAIVICSALVAIFKIDIPTIGRIYHIDPQIKIADFGKVDLPLIVSLIFPAISIAVLSAIQGLLSATSADNQTETVHNSSNELFSLGVANIVCAVFTAMPVTGAVARTNLNVKCGGKTPLANLFHSLFLFVFFMLLLPLIDFIPLCVLSALLIVVAVRMMKINLMIKFFASNYRDLTVLFVAFFLTFLLNLIVAILISISIALLFTITDKLVLEKSFDNERLTIKIKGKLNFFNIKRLLGEIRNSPFKKVTLDFKDNSFMDISCLNRLERIATFLSDVEFDFVNTEYIDKFLKRKFY